MIATALRMFLFLLSMGGYILYIRNKWGVRLEFAPALFCAGISGVLLCAGLLNLLPLAWPLLFLGGLWLLAVYGRAWWSSRAPLPRRELLLCGAFVLAAGYFALLLWDIRVNEYDNFSHYATVLMDMLRSNILPSFKSINIDFQAYPVGSTLFQYYVCRVVGAKEHVALWANMLINLSGIFSLAAFARRKNGGLIPVAAFGLFALIWRADMNSLLVDTIQPLSAVAAFAMLYYYRGQGRKTALLAALILSFVINIKNSGVYFAGVCLLCLWFWGGKRPLRRRVGDVWIPAAVCAGLLLIWQRHTAMVYYDAAHSKHALTPHYLLFTIREKHLENVTGTAKALLRETFSLASPVFVSLLLLTLGACLRALAWSWGLYLSYHLGLYAMYVFSMPAGGDLGLAGYDRYAGTGMVFLMGVACVLVMDGFDPGALPAGKRPLALLALLLFLLPLFPYRQKAVSLWSHSYHQKLYEETDRYLLDQVVERYAPPERMHYVVYTEKDPDYLYYLARYDLWVSDLVTVDSLEEARTPELLEENDYLILLYNTPQVRQVLASYGLDCPEDGQPAMLRLPGYTDPEE